MLCGCPFLDQLQRWPPRRGEFVVLPGAALRGERDSTNVTVRHLDGARHRCGHRGRRGRLRLAAGGLRALLRCPRPCRPPDVRGPLPERRLPEGRQGRYVRPVGARGLYFAALLGRRAPCAPADAQQAWHLDYCRGPHCRWLAWIPGGTCRTGTDPGRPPMNTIAAGRRTALGTESSMLSKPMPISADGSAGAWSVWTRRRAGLISTRPAPARPGRASRKKGDGPQMIGVLETSSHSKSCAEHVAGARKSLAPVP